MMFEGFFDKINRIQTGLDHLTIQVAKLSNDIEINLESLENRINLRLNQIKEELKMEIKNELKK